MQLRGFHVELTLQTRTLRTLVKASYENGGLMIHGLASAEEALDILQRLEAPGETTQLPAVIRSGESVTVKGETISFKTEGAETGRTQTKVPNPANVSRPPRPEPVVDQEAVTAMAQSSKKPAKEEKANGKAARVGDDLEGQLAASVKPKANGKPEKEPESSEEAQEPAQEEEGDELMAELKTARKLRDVLISLHARGFETVESLQAECMKLKDKVPVLGKIENLSERVERTFESTDFS